MTNEEFNEYMRCRLKAFVIAVFNFLDSVPITPVTRLLIYQLSKSSSSAGSNFRAFCRGRSPNERFAKICIVVEEADESQFWLEIFCDRFPENRICASLLAEATELVMITTSIKTKFST